MQDLSNIYNHLYSNNYGESGRFGLIQDYLKRVPLEDKVLDLGCGHGKYTVKLREMGYDAHGMDIIEPELTSCPEYYTKVTGYKYPMFDTIICLDVLEHIPPEEIPEILTGIKNSCDKAIMTIAHSKAYHKGPNGEELHLTVEKWNWWDLQLQKAGFHIKQTKYYQPYNMTSLFATVL